MVLSMSSQDDLRPRYPMSRRAFVSMVTAGAASTLIQGTAAAAQPLPKARNVVLVHGLFTDGSSWSEVIPRLQAAGLSVTSVQNPLTTLPEAVASAERVLARQDGRTVLAGHSFSGIIVTEAGVHPNVSALVYVAARAPDAGEDYTALAKTFPTPAATAGIVFDGDEGRLSEAAFLRDFAGDLPEAKAKVLYAVQEEADRKQCPRRFRRSPRRLRSRLRLSQLRLINSTPTSCSRSRIWRLREGCAVCNRFLAASVRLPSSAAAMKKRRCRSSMGVFHISRACPPAYKVF